jgi:hypothetical protein
MTDLALSEIHARLTKLEQQVQLLSAHVNTNAAEMNQVKEQLMDVLDVVNANISNLSNPVIDINEYTMIDPKPILNSTLTNPITEPVIESIYTPTRLPMSSPIMTTTTTTTVTTPSIQTVPTNTTVTTKSTRESEMIAKILML